MIWTDSPIFYERAERQLTLELTLSVVDELAKKALRSQCNGELKRANEYLETAIEIIEQYRSNGAKYESV